MKYATLASFLVAFPFPAQGQKPLEPADVFKKSTPSVALLLIDKKVNGEMKEFRATGFVIEGPNRRKQIVTCAHALAGASAVCYELPGMPGPRSCKSYLLHPKADLALLNPYPEDEVKIEANPLEIADMAGASPANGTRVVASGHPLGTPKTFKGGVINGDPVRVRKLAADLNAAPEGFGELDPDLVLLRYDANMVYGMSGAPLQDMSERVVGVQMAHLPDGKSDALAIPIHHLRDKPLVAAATEFKADQRLALGVPRAIDMTANSKGQIRVNNPAGEFDVRCFHRGYVPRNGKYVLNCYVQDSDRFNKFFTVERLSEGLKRTDLAHITNPALGFSVLVPRGFAFETTPTQDPPGVLVSIHHPDYKTFPPPYDRPLRIWVFSNPERCAAIHAGVAKRIAAGGAMELPALQRAVGSVKTLETYADFHVWAISYFRAEMAKIYRFRIDGGDEVGDKRAPLYTQQWNLEFKDRWQRYNFIPENGQVCQAVHVAFREPRFAAVHYAFNLSDRDKFNAGKEPDPAFRDYALIAATISLY